MLIWHYLWSDGDISELPMGHQVDNNMLVMQDIHAQVLAARRDLSILQQQARVS